MNHKANPGFWKCYHRLPTHIRKLADNGFQLLKKDCQHPSLHFKKVGRFRSVRVGMHYRAIGVDFPRGVVWFWIGSHEEYNKLIK